MKAKIAPLIATSTLALGIVTAAAAAPVNTNPITSDYYIEHNGLYWAWVSPVSTQDFFNINELYMPDIQDGWRFATEEEWAMRPTAADFGTESNFKCAAQFWNSDYTHCDYADGESEYWTYAWDAGEDPTDDLLYVRDIRDPNGGGNTDVPAPGALGLLGVALTGLGLMRRRKRA